MMIEIDKRRFMGLEQETGPEQEPVEDSAEKEATPDQTEGVVKEFRGKGEPSHTDRMLEMLEEEKKKTEKGYGSSPVSWQDHEGTR
jgi:hypothetical protein